MAQIRTATQQTTYVYKTSIRFAKTSVKIEFLFAQKQKKQKRIHNQTRAHTAHLHARSVATGKLDLWGFGKHDDL